MNTGTNTRLLITKATLWFLVGTATVTGICRLFLGLGATTALSDAVPWGLWKSFNVLACIPMAAAGFVIAGIVHCFHIKRYHAIARVTVLMAFLGYMTAVTGLVLDIGKPWNIWRPIFYWNMHSPLFEVAWCIILYATVMLAEFAPVIGERFGWKAFVRVMKKMTPVLAVLAVAISTLHQSTLGTLFTLGTERLHPLWFSPIQNIIFFVSAIGMGLCFISLLTLFSRWLYRQEIPWSILHGLTRVASYAVLLYAVLRLGDLGLRGQLQGAFENSLVAWMFWIEIILGAIVPFLLFTIPSVRKLPWAITWGAIAAIIGLIMQRAGVGTYSQYLVVDSIYIPTLAELSVTLGVISILGVIFMFAVENLKVWEKLPERPKHYTPTRIDPLTSLYVGETWLGGSHRGVQAWMFGVVIGLVVVEFQVPGSLMPEARAVEPVRHVAVQVPVGETTEASTALMISNSDQVVLFAHEAHQGRLGNEDSCVKCHHRNIPMSNGTPCSQCHQDMYRTTDTFSHARHTAALKDPDDCASCHPGDAQPKTRMAARACDDCHVPLEGTLVRPATDTTPGMAPGYVTAIHGLCLNCHQEQDVTNNEEQPRLALCETCHRQGTESPAELMIKTDLAAGPIDPGNR